MPEPKNLDQLSNSEIRALWRATTEKARTLQEQRRANAAKEPNIEAGFYKDAWGNMVEGVPEKRKENRYYTSPEGYIVYLKEGEEAPKSSGNGMVDWLNKQNIAADPELREALGDEALYFEVDVSGVSLVGELKSDGWYVVGRSQDTNFRFRLSAKLTKEEAIAEAESYTLAKIGPQFKNLSEDEERMIERMAASNRLQAFVFYLQARLPDDLADRFLELGANGDELAILQFAADEQISSIAEEAVAHSFYWANPRANSDFFDYVRANDDGRTWTFAFLDSLWSQYAIRNAADKLRPQTPPVTEAGIDELSDEEIARLLTQTRQLRNKNR